MQKDHVHMLIAHTAEIRGVAGGRGYMESARGYSVPTVGRDEAVIRKYMQQQEQEDKRLHQLNLAL